MQLADDHTLGAVDNERPILGHQRNIAKEDFLLLDVANTLRAGLRVFVKDGETDGDFERGRVGHPALFALVHVILQLQANWIAAFVAEIGCVRVVGSAPSAQNFAGMERIGNDCGSAIAAGSA